MRLVEPHTEADSVALLGQFLVCFGNLIGRDPHIAVEADKHHTNEFMVLVGDTSKARKGTSWGHARRPLSSIEPEWADRRQQSGLSSGEGLIWAVRDPIVGRSPIREGGRVTGYQEVQDDPGVADKRLLVYEPEFASTLRVMEREGSTLSGVIRQAWDTGDLRILTKKSPAIATGGHISIVGHVTREELRRYLGRTEAANGFANRFLWLCVRRSKLLPRGGRLQAADLHPVLDRLRRAADWARGQQQLDCSDAAWAFWDDVYENLSEGRPGLLGAVISRAEAHVLRLSLIYALLDCTPVIERCHLEAALSLWRYAEASARYIFGDALGDPFADELLDALRAQPNGLTRTEISGHFGRHRSANEIARALAALSERNLVRSQSEVTRGRTAERWFPLQGANQAKEAKSCNIQENDPSPSSHYSHDGGAPAPPSPVDAVAMVDSLLRAQP